MVGTDGDTNKKPGKNRLRLVLKKCYLCGSRRKEEDMSNDTCCVDCLRKQGTDRNSWTFRNGAYAHKSKATHVNRQ